MWERGELGVGGLMLSERCGWRGIQYTALLETLGICSLREMRRQVARVLNRYPLESVVMVIVWVSQKLGS